MYANIDMKYATADKNCVPDHWSVVLNDSEIKAQSSLVNC